MWCWSSRVWLNSDREHQNWMGEFNWTRIGYWKGRIIDAGQDKIVRWSRRMESAVIKGSYQDVGNGKRPTPAKLKKWTVGKHPHLPNLWLTPTHIHHCSSNREWLLSISSLGNLITYPMLTDQSFHPDRLTPSHHMNCHIFSITALATHFVKPLF